MADYCNPQQGDPDDAGAISVVIGHDNVANYVGYGLEITADFSAGTFDLGEGKAFILLDAQSAPRAGHDKHKCLLTAHYDARTGIGLPYTTNYIWARFNLGTADSPKIDVTDTATAPSNDSLLIGKVDTSAQTVEERNRDPSGTFTSLSADELFIDTSVTWPDGQTTDSHPLMYGDEINNYNEYYDVQADNPQGVVAEADWAATADIATHADTAVDADTATDSDQLEGNTLSEVIDHAADEIAREWEPLETITHTDLQSRAQAEFSVASYDYGRYRIRFQLDCHSTDDGWTEVRVNGIDDKAYTINHHDYKRSYWTTTWSRANNSVVGELEISFPDSILDHPPKSQKPLLSVNHTPGGKPMNGALHRSVDELQTILFRAHEEDDHALEARLYGKHGI